jgi:hypothetical protein
MSSYEFEMWGKSVLWYIVILHWYFVGFSSAFKVFIEDLGVEVSRCDEIQIIKG